MDLLSTIIVSSIVFFIYITGYRAYSTYQFKKSQETQKKVYHTFQNKLQVGQNVLFSGGLSGKIVSFKDEWAIIEVSRGQTIEVLKGAITDVL